MKISKSQLKKVIREEYVRFLTESMEMPGALPSADPMSDEMSTDEFGAEWGAEDVGETWGDEQLDSPEGELDDEQPMWDDEEESEEAPSLEKPWWMSK